jgi:hypothetical protein
VKKQEKLSEHVVTFICFVKLLAKQDQVFEELISKLNGQIKHTNLLVQTTQMQLVSEKIKYKLIVTIKETPFLSIILDTNENVSKCSQQGSKYILVIIQTERDKNGKTWRSPFGSDHAQTIEEFFNNKNMFRFLK